MKTRLRISGARIAFGLAGVLFMAYGLWGGLSDAGIERVPHLTFLAVILLLHDAVLLPLAIGIGALLARVLPQPTRRTVYGGLFASAMALVVGIPVLLGGRASDNPSLLPRDYRIGLLGTLVTIWLVVGVTILIRRRVGVRGERA